MRYFISLMLLLFGLGGCASLSQEACLAGDWYAVGVADGRRGRLPERLDDHRQACRDYTVTPDRALYLQGRSEGLQQYCTAEGGYHAGLRGDPYRDVCSQAQEQQFLPAYQRGRRIHEYERCLERYHDHFYHGHLWHGYHDHFGHHPFFWRRFECFPP